MSYSVYLAVIARALQDQIASEVTSEYAREILMVSAEALASMAVSLESSDAGPNDDESWIRELVNHTGLVQNQEPVNSEDISDLPPSPPPPENLAALGKTARLIGAAAEWVERLNWQEANEKTKKSSAAFSTMGTGSYQRSPKENRRMQATQGGGQRFC